MSGQGIVITLTRCFD